ncbi:hypothetical protein AMTRI_Chr13g117380 [Amborella trichopoda]
MGGWAIAVHGGAGIDPSLPLQRQEEACQALLSALHLGISALRSASSAVDVVELVVRELELNPLFNSGCGSALTAQGTVEMDASIMDGSTRKCGAVSGISTVKNPISLARLVMDKSPHAYLAFDGAEAFARQHGAEIVDTSFFIIEENVIRLKQAKEAKSIQFDYRLPSKGWDTCASEAEQMVQMNGVPISLYSPETVGCVVVDALGRCAAATSTGGLINKMCGRIGDSPLIGAGTYACNICAVSATGEGEAIIRATLARDVAALMEFKGMSLKEAVDCAIHERLEDGKGGLIAVSNDGHVICGFNTTGMFRALATEDGHMEVGLWD